MTDFIPFVKVAQKGGTKMYWRWTRSLEITSRTEVQGKIILVLKGHCTETSADDMRTMFGEAIIKRGYKEILCDMRKCKMNGNGVALMIDMQTLATRNFSEIILVGLPAGLTIPESSKLSGHFKVANDIPSGSATFSRQ